MSQFVVVVFPNEARAYEGTRALKALHCEGSLTLYGMAVIAKDVAGKFSVKEAADAGPLGTAVGALVGGLVGGRRRLDRADHDATRSLRPQLQFRIEIREGVVLYGYGGADIRGKVAGNGAVSVSVASGEQTASGTGQLSGNSGRGTWQGRGSRGVCSGRWSASRR